MRRHREEPDDMESGEGWSEGGLLGANEDEVELDEDIPRGGSAETNPPSKGRPERGSGRPEKSSSYGGKNRQKK